MARVRIAPNVELELNSDGIRQIERGPEVMAELQRRGRAIAAAAGPGFEVSSFIGRNRARVEITAVSEQAKEAEASDRVLTRALDAGRG